MTRASRSEGQGLPKRDGRDKPGHDEAKRISGRYGRQAENTMNQEIMNLFSPQVPAQVFDQ
ncbi:MAG TPA: hypothetical protein VFP79_05290, partial [Pseudolabrys sp.]|nr:hypothetical protein [Pseudolabrys sp.]